MWDTTRSGNCDDSGWYEYKKLRNIAFACTAKIPVRKEAAIAQPLPDNPLLKYKLNTLENSLD